MEPGAQRQVRVFVSSTFRDMQGERDELVKRVFPAIRKRCESRGVAFSEVDLRWGVTDEQKAEGQVLPICLAEIRRCHPYFIGLLGERYGWVPDELPGDLLASEAWLAEAHGRSVTELEILYGVLNDPDMADHCFFYFADPAAKAGDAEPELAAREKLAALKARLRDQSLPLREGYRDPRELGAWVLADFEALIDRLFPAEEAPDSLAREAAVHEAYLASRARVYVPRADLFALLDAHVAGDGPPVAVLGASGTGKSALLANWALGLRAAGTQVPVIAHFAGASAQSADWTVLCRHVIASLARAFGLGLAPPDDPLALREALRDALWRAAAHGRYVLVLDGLNQLEDRDGAPDLVWLPVDLPREARLVASTLPGRALDEAGRRGWSGLVVEALAPPERERLVHDYLARFAKALSGDRTAALAAAGQTANPLYLRVVLDELRQHGSHETLDAVIADLLAAPDVPELYQRVLARWEADYQEGRPGLVRDAMSLLWAARRGLAEAELRDLLGSAGAPLPQAAWSPLFLAADEALLNRSGLLGFAHDYLRQAVEARYLGRPEDRRDAHLRLADYFASRPFEGRAVEELPWQLAEAGDHTRLAALLADPASLEVLFEGREHEVKRYWARIRTESDLSLPAAYADLVAGAPAPPAHVWRIATLLADMGHPGEGLELRRRLVAEYRLSGDAAALQAAAGNLALSLMAAGDLAEAEALFGEQEALCREIGHDAGLQAALGYRSMAARARGDLAGALFLLEQQEAICRAIGLADGLQACLGTQALVFRELGDLDRALALLGEQERLCRQLDLQQGLQAALGNTALVLRMLGDLRGALDLHAREERLCRELGNRQALQACLGNQGIVRRMLGETYAALRLHAEEERICRDLGYKEGLKASLGNQALLHAALGDHERALAFHAAEEALCRELSSPLGLQASLGNQSLVRLERGEVDLALGLAAEQARICEDFGFKEGLSCALDNLGQILAARGDRAEALAYFGAALRLAEELGLRDGVAESYGNQAQVWLAQGEYEAALALLERQEAICREVGLSEGLCKALWRQGEALATLGRGSEARFLLEEAAELAAAHSLGRLEPRIRDALGSLA
ncbi:MAG: DUF4062 domain-containing protein [Candidatus Sericytochromatia bacterium]|nr:DUF4062 domain-containing protein [Candidatus Tanganyikabacteria bacterium]